MGSFWEHPPPPASNTAMVETFVRTMRGVSPRVRVQTLHAMQRALEDAVRRHDPAEVATLAECLRHLRVLLHQRAE